MLITPDDVNSVVDADVDDLLSIIRLVYQVDLNSHTSQGTNEQCFVANLMSMK